MYWEKHNLQLHLFMHSQSWYTITWLVDEAHQAHSIEPAITQFDAIAQKLYYIEDIGLLVGAE